MDLGHNTQEKILRQRTHRRPVLDIRPEHQLFLRLRLSPGIEHTILVNCLVKMVLRLAVLHINLCRSCQEALVCRRRCDGTRIHQRNRSNLAILHLRAFPVWEVPGRMADGEGPICRGVARTKAGSAECSLDNTTGFDQISKAAILHQLHVNRHGSRVNAHRELVVADRMATENVRSRADILKSAACTAGDDPLVDIELPVHNLVLKRIADLSAEGNLRTLLHIVEHVLQVLLHILNGIDIARMERHRDHRADFRQVHADTAIVIGKAARIHFSVGGSPAVDLIEVLCLLICSPDRAQAGCLRRHHIDTDSEVFAQASDARADELHDLVLDITLVKHRADDGQRNILRSNPGCRLSLQIDCDDAGHVDVVGLTEKLLDQLAAALSHRHRPECPVAGMGVRAQDHRPALGKHLACELVDDGLMRRDIDAAVLLRR